MNDCLWYCLDTCMEEDCTNCKYYFSRMSGVAVSMMARRDKEMNELLKPLYAKDKERFEEYKNEQGSKHE